jgi:carboxymethylenebutenolidase
MDHFNKRMIGLAVFFVLLVSAGLYLDKLDGGFYGYSKHERNSEMLQGEDTVDVSVATVKYFGDVEGYLAEPQAEGQYPGVVVIHEWWGLNDHIRAMASELAGEGYRVLAVDLFGTVAATPDEAREQTSALDQEEAVENLQAASAYLRQAGSSRVASLGWCFGGGQSLQLALSGEDLEATVIYYGQLVTDPAALAALDQPVLGIFGDEDASISVEQVTQFQAALNQAGTPNSIYIYPGVGHAFANPSGMNYAAAETRDAWSKTLTFLAENLQQ